MAETANITPLGEIRPFDPTDERDTMIRVDDVSMVFNMASEQLNNLKEYAIAIVRRELMFKEFRALDGVSLEVKKGDVYGILGTNGSGKSTLLKIVAGVLEPTEGSVSIHGNIAPLIELGAGFDMELTARENIYLNGSLLGYPKKFIAQHFDEIVEFAEIEQFLDMPLKNYSSGMVARIAFAIATVIVPDILIVDEVLSVGDFMFQQKCERRIQSLIKDHGVTVLIVSHNNDQIERLCNKAIWIEKGHTRMIGSAREVCEVYRLLGGHVGAPEAEARVFEMLKDPIEPDEGAIKTIAGDDRSGTSVKLLDETGGLPGQRALVMAPGGNASACMLANAVAGALDTNVLLTKQASMSDVVAKALREAQPESIYVIGDETLVEEPVAAELADVANAVYLRANAAQPSQLALLAYEAASEMGGIWGRTAIITYDGCTGDMLSLIPFMYSQKCPLFFNAGPGDIDAATMRVLTSGAFDRVIVLGGQKSFPDACVQPIADAGIEIIRFCGRDPFHANRLINEWIANDRNSVMNELLVTSVWNPPDGFAMGAYAASHHAAVLLEDPQDLNSVVNAFDFIAENANTINRLTFLGGNDRFTPQDKRLLAKALAKAKRPS